MATPTRRQLADWRDRQARGQAAVGEGRHDDAQQLFAGLQTELRPLGLESAHVLWGLGVVADLRGDFASALEFLERALELDPVGVPYATSYGIVIGRLRSTLADPARCACDPTTPLLYDLLSNRNEADLDSHLALGRHLVHAGKHAEAACLLEAVVLLNGASPEAWALLEASAQALGNQKRAEEARTQRRLLMPGDPRLAPNVPRAAA